MLLKGRVLPVDPERVAARRAPGPVLTWRLGCSGAAGSFREGAPPAMPAPPPRHLRARPRRLAAPLRWLLLTALLVPLVAGLTSVGTQPTAEAAPGSPAAVAVKFAISQLGKPYRWGADGPRSFDCSGLVQTAYRAAGVALPRVSRHQYGAGTHVSLGSLCAGDLLFYAKDTSDPRTIYHVGMYLGAGRMVEAPTPGPRSGSPPCGARGCSAGRPGRPPACGGCSRSSWASAATPWPPSSGGWPPTASACTSTASSAPRPAGP